MFDQHRQPLTATPSAKARPYYEAMGDAHDDLLRCNDCKRLVVCTTLRARGGCPHCGTRRVVEVRSLSVWEWLRIRLGLLQFAHRQAFLREFSRG